MRGLRAQELLLTANLVPFRGEAIIDSSGGVHSVKSRDFAGSIFTKKCRVGNDF